MINVIDLVGVIIPVSPTPLLPVKDNTGEGINSPFKPLAKLPVVLTVELDVTVPENPLEIEPDNATDLMVATGVGAVGASAELLPPPPPPQAVSTRTKIKYNLFICFNLVWF